jgi:hypothetical protein
MVLDPGKSKRGVPTRLERDAKARATEALEAALVEVERGLRDVGEVEAEDRIAELRRSFDIGVFRVVIFGEFNRGKSTLINALLGRMVLPTSLIPTTGHVCRIVGGARDEVRVYTLDGNMVTCGFDQLDSLSTLDRTGRAREDVALIEVATNSPLLNDGLVLVDTPGVNDCQAQTQRGRRAIESADMVILLLKATQLLTSLEKDLAVDWLVRDLGKPVVPVINFMNMVEYDDQKELRLRLDRWCRELEDIGLGRPWFEVNAKGALEYGLGRKEAPTDDFEALRQALAGLTGPKRRQLQDRSRLGQLRAEILEVRSRNSQVLTAIRHDAAQVDNERETLRRDLKTRASRLSADVKTRRDRLELAAGRVLDLEIENLINTWIKGQSRETLRDNASRWHDKRLFEAVQAIEKSAEAALLELVDKHMQRPEPLTLREHMSLMTRLEVGYLPAIDASDGVLLGGGIAGGVVGQMLIPIPVVGFMVGLYGGGWLANRLGQKKPDYAAAYIAKARESWANARAKVLAVTFTQFDARTDGLKNDIDRAMRKLGSEKQGSKSLPAELQRREDLEEAIWRCQHELAEQ